jgi:predicted nucleic acid-binding protein
MSLKESKVMVDSSIWVEIIRGTKKGEKAVDFLVPLDAITTTISIAEVERVLLRGGEGEKIVRLDRIIGSSAISITSDIAKKAARLSIEKSLGLADALIAAASELNDCLLYTTDRDFIGKGLKVKLLE